MPAMISLSSHRLINSATTWLCRASLLLVAYSLTAGAQEPVPQEADSSIASIDSSSSSQSSEAPLYESRAMRDKSLIADAMNEEAQWLDTTEGKILALYRQTESRKTYGVLVLFHAAEHPQSWPPILENLRANLPRYGWETLAISLPQSYPAPIPARPSSSAASASAAGNDGETTAEDPTGTSEPDAEPQSASASSSGLVNSSSSAASSSVAREQLISAYVDAAFEFLKTKGQFNTVVLVDNSAAHPVLEHLLAQIRNNEKDPTTVDGPLQALVITNLQQQEPNTKAELEDIFRTAKLPVLDIFFVPNSPEQYEARNLHKATALRKKVIDYQQLLLDLQPQLIDRDYQSFIVGRVRGFMRQKASGTEVKGTAATDTL
jgi:hypothetical protein